MIRMPGFLFIILIANSMMPILTLSDRSISEGKHRRLIVCDLPSGITVNITFTMQTYYQLQCPTTEYDAVGAFLYDYFQKYSAFDQALGPLALVPTTQKLCTTSQARRLNDAGTNALVGEKERKLQGASTGYIWKAPAICKLCKPDTRDGRSLSERQLQFSSFSTSSTSSMTSPVTIVIKTDAFPTETSYRLRTMTSNRDIVISPMFTAPETVYTQTVYLEPGKDYRLTMRDAFGDGICCYYGPGYVQINAGTSIKGPIIAAERGDYGLTRTLYFTVPTSMPPTTINLPLMELRYSDYLTYYVQQFFHFNSLSCLYGSNPTISVKLLQLPHNTSVPTSCI